MKRKSMVPKWVKRGEGKIYTGKGCNNPMNFHTRDAKKFHPPSNKGRTGNHAAKDNIKH